MIIVFAVLVACGWAVTYRLKHNRRHVPRLGARLTGHAEIVPIRKAVVVNLAQDFENLLGVVTATLQVMTCGVNRYGLLVVFAAKSKTGGKVAQPPSQMPLLPWANSVFAGNDRNECLWLAHPRRRVRVAHRMAHAD